MRVAQERGIHTAPINISVTDKANIKIFVMLWKVKFLNSTAQRRQFPNNVAKLIDRKKTDSTTTTAVERVFSNLAKWEK